MNSTSKEVVLFDGIPYQKDVMLADVNIPYKLSIDRKNNKLFFCINADTFSDQSFQSVVFDLESRLVNIIPGIRNGFASAVDQATGDVYLGGSDGIFKYNYTTNDIDKPALVKNLDVFDMCFNNSLYFVDTCAQHLHIYKDNKHVLIDVITGIIIHHFIIIDSSDLFYVNPTGLYFLPNGNKTPRQLDSDDINIRGIATDVNGVLFLIARDGIYNIDRRNWRITKVFSVYEGHGLAFDRNNNIIYSDERSVIGLFRV